MSSPRKTAIVTGPSQGIGAGSLVKDLSNAGFNVVANSRKIDPPIHRVAALIHVARVDGHSANRKQPPDRRDGACRASSSSSDALSPRRDLLHQAVHGLHGPGRPNVRSSPRTSRASYVTQLASQANARASSKKNGGSPRTKTAALAANPIRRREGLGAMITRVSRYDLRSTGD